MNADQKLKIRVQILISKSPDQQWLSELERMLVLTAAAGNTGWHHMW